MKNTIYLSKRMGKEILKDMEFVMNSRSWSEVERVYDKYSSMFAKKMEPLFGEDGAVALEHDVYNYEFATSPIERLKTGRWRAMAKNDSNRWVSSLVVY